MKYWSGRAVLYAADRVISKLEIEKLEEKKRDEKLRKIIREELSALKSNYVNE